MTAASTAIAVTQTIEAVMRNDWGRLIAALIARLRLIFTCCHPAIDAKSRVTLTLRTRGGLTTPGNCRRVP